MGQLGQLFQGGGLTNPGTALASPNGGPTFVGSPQQVLDRANQSINQASGFDANGMPIMNANLPTIGTPTVQQAASAGAMPGSVNAVSPGLSKLGKVLTFINAGAQGALAARNAQEQMIAATGGRRAGGVGTGFEAGYQLPIMRALQQQAFQRGGLENQILQAQVQFNPLLQLLGLQKSQADINKANAEAGKANAEAGAVPIKSALEQAQQQAAYFKDDPNLGLIDLRTGQPVNNAGFAPLGAQEAAILGKQAGDMVPLKLKNTASEIAQRGVRAVQANGRSLLVDSQGNTIKDMGVATPLATINAQMNAPAQVTPQMQNAVDMVGNGRVDLATALAPFRRFPGASEAFLGDLAARYPNYSQATYGVSKKTAEYFTTGQGATQLTAFRTAIQHADLLQQAAQALDNGDSRALNTITNTLQSQFGDPRLTTFDAIANAYNHEVGTVVSKGHVTDSEVKTGGATMPSNANYATIKSVTDAYKSLMASKAMQLQVQYDQGVKGQPAFPQDTPQQPTPTHRYNPQTRKIEPIGAQP